MFGPVLFELAVDPLLKAAVLRKFDPVGFIEYEVVDAVAGTFVSDRFVP